jgi:hypothetical protein
MGAQVYELLIFIALSVVLESGLGILYGVGVGYDPIMVFPAAVLLNFAGALIAVLVMDALFNWKKGIKPWIERRLGRGQKLVDKYGTIGIVMGIVVLSPIQLAVVGKLLCMKPSKLYPALFVAICIVAVAYLAIALGVFKILLKW